MTAPLIELLKRERPLHRSREWLDDIEALNAEMKNSA
jgi:hypothetical protein